MWTNPQNVRDLLGVDMDTATDDILEEFIKYAQIYIRKYIQCSIIDEKLSGNINSTNNTFTTEYVFFADVTGDTLITTADFTVYGWPDSDNPFGRVELAVNTFDPLRGKIVLETAPSQDDYDKLTIDYSYYTKRIDWALLSLGTAWKAAELWVKREEYLVPETWVMGSKRIIQKQPWRFYEIEVNRIIDKLRALPMDKVAYEKLVFRPRGPDYPEVDTTAAKEIRQEGKYTPPQEIKDIVENADS